MMTSYNINDLRNGNISLERLNEVVNTKIELIDETIINRDDLRRVSSYLQDLTAKLYVFTKKEMTREKDEVILQNVIDDTNLGLFNRAIVLNQEFIDFLDNVVTFFKEKELEEKILEADIQYKSTKEEEKSKQQTQEDIQRFIEQAEAIRLEAEAKAYLDAVTKVRAANDNIIFYNNQLLDIKERMVARKKAAVIEFNTNINEVFKNHPDIYQGTPQNALDILAQKMFNHHDYHNQQIEEATQRRMAEYHSKNTGMPGMFSSGWKTSSDYAKLQNDIDKIEKSRINGTIEHHSEHGISIDHNTASMLSKEINTEKLQSYSKAIFNDKQEFNQNLDKIKKEVDACKNNLNFLKKGNLDLISSTETADLLDSFEENLEHSNNILDMVDEFNLDEEFDLDSDFALEEDLSIEDEKEASKIELPSPSEKKGPSRGPA